MQYVRRVGQLAGLCEAQQVMDPDEQDRLDSEQLQRERRINQLIALAFKRIGLSIADDGIFYQEDVNREARVTLDDSEVDLGTLIRLQQTGLADRYVVSTDVDGELQIVFNVSPNLDFVKA